MAMRFLARGGIYIAGGGIAAKLIDRIRDGRVLKAYLLRTMYIEHSHVDFACKISMYTLHVYYTEQLLGPRGVNGGGRELPAVCFRYD